MVRWDITTALFIQSKSMGAEGGSFVKPDGTRIYIINGISETLRQYTLPTPWSLTGATFNTSISLPPAFATGSSPKNLWFKPDGTKFWYVDSFINSGWISFAPSANLEEYTMTTPWDISTATNTQSINIREGAFAINEGQPTGIAFNPNGNIMYITTATFGTLGQQKGFTDTIYQFNLSTPFNPATRGNPVGTFQGGFAWMVWMRDDGLKFFTINNSNVREYDLTTAFQINTAVFVANRSASPAQGPQSVAFQPDGTKYIITENVQEFPTNFDNHEYFISPFTKLPPVFVDAILVGTKKTFFVDAAEFFFPDTIAGQRLTLPEVPVRILSVKFNLRRSGVKDPNTKGTIRGIIIKNAIPGGLINPTLGTNILATSINTINVEDLATDSAGTDVIFSFSGNPEIFETVNMFIGVEINGSNEEVCFAAESTGTALGGGNMIKSEGPIWGSELGVDAFMEVLRDTTPKNRALPSMSATIVPPQLQTKIKEFLVEGAIQRTFGRGMTSNARLFGRSGETGGIPPQEPEVNSLIKRLGENGTEGAGLKSFTIDGLITDDGIKFTCVDALFPNPGLVEDYFINGLLQTTGDNGSNGGDDIDQGVDDGVIIIPIGTLVGQRLTLATTPLRILNLKFTLHRDGLSGGATGTLTGKIYRNSVPGTAISGTDLIATSTNFVNVSTLTTSATGTQVTFAFTGIEETSPNNDIFLGFDVSGANEQLFLHTESTGTAISGGDVTVESPSGFWGGNLGVDATFEMIVDPTVQNRGFAIMNTLLLKEQTTDFEINAIIVRTDTFDINAVLEIPAPIEEINEFTIDADIFDPFSSFTSESVVGP